MVLWFIFALGSALAKTFAEITGKQVMINEHALGYSTARSMIMVVFALFFIPLMNFNIPLKAY